MTGDWAPRRRREATLRALDTRLAASPDAVEPRFARARLLTELGRTEDAITAYIEILGRSPTHFGALNNLGALLHATGYRTAARTAYAEAAAHHPDEPMGHVNLANILCESGAPVGAREHYETALQLMPDHAEAHQGLARLLDELGEEDAAERHLRQGFTGRAVAALPYRGDRAPLQVLLLVSARGGNVPLRHHLDDRIFQIFAVYPEFYDPKEPLPPHRLVVNAIGDADRCRPALEAAAAVLARTETPVVNHPAAVLATGRVANARRLAAVPDLIAPRTATVPRASLMRPDAAAALRRDGFAFPLLMRSPGFHTGRHFLRVESDDELPAALAVLPGRDLTVIQCLDARGADGKARKYRVMFIDGRLYPLHLAISDHWKVHYFTAEMAERPDHRAEDARFLADMPGVLGPRGMAALARICDTLGLDYAGIDFGLGSDGRMLLFETNAAMVVNPPERDPKWAYREPAARQIHDAVHAMLIARAKDLPSISLPRIG